jgi:eukaryotic-like serine/threonine-protein kinase
VLISNEDRVTILDFGLAGNVERDADASAQEVGGGTPGYMAPEQLGTQAPTAACDWYAVGGILYESLTGK